jgi:hypothetical protein
VTGVAAPTTYRASAHGDIHHLNGGKTTELVTVKKSTDSWIVVAFAKLGD